MMRCGWQQGQGLLPEPVIVKLLRVPVLCRAILRAAAGDEGGRRAGRHPNALLVSEAYPESEFSLNPDAGTSGRVACRPV
jgi:hypothetical protein